MNVKEFFNIKELREKDLPEIREMVYDLQSKIEALDSELNTVRSMFWYEIDRLHQALIEKKNNRQ